MRKLLLVPLLATGALFVNEPVSAQPTSSSVIPVVSTDAPPALPSVSPLPANLPEPGAPVPPAVVVPGPLPGTPLPVISGVSSGSGCAACATATPPAPAAPAPAPTCPVDNTPPGTDSWALFDNGVLRFGGWVQAGGVANSFAPSSRYNGPYNAQDLDNVYLNQLYLFFEKRLSGDGFDIGGRADVFFGNDYLLAQSRGLEVRDNGAPKWNTVAGGTGFGDYGLVIPQAYLEAGYGPLSVKVGHFYTIVGYESVMSPYNFFYTHSYSYQFAGPFTHWGAIGKLDLGQVVVQGGVVNGWNSLYAEEEMVSGIGSIGVKSADDRFRLTYQIIYGDEPTYFNRQPYTPRCRMSLLAEQDLTCKVSHATLFDLAWQENRQINGETGFWYGISDYWFYKLSEKFILGFRGEWFRDEDGTRAVGVRRYNPNGLQAASVNLPAFNGNFYAISTGVNWLPCPNVLIRPELRLDWYNRTGGGQDLRPFDDGNEDVQFLFACDVILRF